MRLNSPPPPPAVPLPMRAARAVTLLVDPEPLRCAARGLLLCGAACTLQAICTPGEIYRLQTREDPQIAILSAELGAEELTDVARHVRRRWPHARILVIGHAEGLLDDPLYDETVTAEFSPEELLKAIERCKQYPC